MPQKTVAITSTLGPKFSIATDIRGHRIVIDQPASAGGADEGPTPLELVLTSLAGCIGTIGRIIAMQRRITLRGMTITAEAALDVDGLLGKPIDGRIGFESITLRVDVDADLSAEEKEAFIHEVDHRCPVSENLLNATPIHVRLA